MHLHILIAGFNRSLSHTWPSIEKNVIGSANRSGAKVSISSVISYAANAVENIRTGESGWSEQDIPEELKSAEGALLEQEAIDESLTALVGKALPVLDPPDEEHRQLVMNLLRFLRIQQIACNLIDSSADYVFVTRPDLKYLGPVDFGALLPFRRKALFRQKSDVLIPTYGGGKHPNDFFALMKAEAASTYLNRLSQFENYIHTHLPFGAEIALGYSLRNLTVERALDTRVKRVRLLGMEKDEKFRINRPFERYLDTNQYL